VTLKLILVFIRDEFTFNSSQGRRVFRLLYYSQMFLYFGTYINDKFYLSNFRLTNLVAVETIRATGFNIKIFVSYISQNKQQLHPCINLNGRVLRPRWEEFTARYGLNLSNKTEMNVRL
jgi:hypothetical protein